jgi:hypothetical protein
MCWDYLRVSPSYWLVHQERTGKIRISKRQRTKLGLAQVERTYAVLGDVYSGTFRNWFSAHARSAFGLAGLAGSASCLAFWPAIQDLESDDYGQLTSMAQTWVDKTLAINGDCGVLVLLVPATKRYTGSLGFVNTLLQSQWPALVADRRLEYSIRTDSKQRLQALWQNLALVRLRADYWQEERWRIGARFARYQWRNEFAPRLDPTMGRGTVLLDEKYWRHIVDMNIDRKLKYALCVAENAARGEFPSNAPLKASAPWDFADGQLGARLSGLSF